MISKAEAKPIGDIFSGVFYVVPEYQREYSWGRDQWENLFNDLNDSASEAYFLGTIICISEDNKPMQVIDGQQRLTTLSIFRLAIFANLSKRKNEFSDDDKMEAYLALKSSLVKDEKNKLQLQSKNKDEYVKLIKKIIKNDDKQQLDGRLRIVKAYSYFEEKIGLNSSIEDIFNILNKINSALIVRIEVKSDQDAFILFESINNRGMPLSPIDLIKNKLFAVLSNKKIGSIESNNLEWQKILENIPEFDDQVRFLRHYYHAFKNEDKIKFAKFAKATKTNLINIYSSLIEKEPKYIFDELINKSDTYGKFARPKETEKLYDLLKLGAAPANALLLYVYSKFPNEDFERLLNFIENWFIRRHITDYPNTNKLDQIFIDLIEKLKEYSFDEIVSFLTHNDRYKSDEELKSILINSALYEKNYSATRCLLIKYEKSKMTKEQGDLSKFWTAVVSEKGKERYIWSIEHIMPQTPDDKTEWSDIPKESYDLNLHRLGNLTLTAYNSNLSNKSFKNKIEAKDKEGKEIGLKSGNVEINVYIKNKTDEKWTIEDIDARSKSMTEEIINLLRY